MVLCPTQTCIQLMSLFLKGNFFSSWFWLSQYGRGWSTSWLHAYIDIYHMIIWSYGHMIILESIPTSCKKSAKKSIRVHLCREQHSCLHICTTNGCPPWLLKDNLVLPRPFMGLFLHLPQQIFGFLYEAVVSNHTPKLSTSNFAALTFK